MKHPIFVIDHREPRIWRWCEIEYTHISQTVGKENVWFTNIKKGSKFLDSLGKVIAEPASKLDLKNACVLDPLAEKILTPQEAKKFDYFVFGGILGDEQLNGRTKKEVTDTLKNVEVRHIGKEQFSTDGAVFVVKRIVDGIRFEDMKFQESLTVEINEYESVDLPYRYSLVNGKPYISPELITHLKKRKTF